MLLKVIHKNSANDDSTLTYFSANKNSLLLRTADIEMKKYDHSQKFNTRLLFDISSQCSYISQTLREILHRRMIQTDILE